jgi:hypothetical protein
MNSIVFSNQQPPKKSKLVNFAVIVLIIVLGFSDKNVREGFISVLSSSSNFLTLIIIAMLGTIFVGTVFFALFHKKTNNNFTLDDQGVLVGNRKYLWIDIKNYHLLGDSQNERFGLASVKHTGGFDLVNPYYGMNIYVLVTKTGFLNNSVRLQVSKERVAEFEQNLASHGLQRESKTHMYLTEVSPSFVIFFLVPFGLIVLILFLF